MNAVSTQESPREKIIGAIQRVAARIEAGKVSISEYADDNGLLRVIKICNEEYRAGNPIVSDHFYDHVLIAELRRRNPEHEFLQEVEPEPELIEGKTVQLPVRMLSTDKAYSLDAIAKWASGVEKVAQSLGITDVFFRITPKLDGFAAYKDSGQLFTRGDGYRGTDISHAIKRGLRIKGHIGMSSPGEIVVDKQYFAEKLAAKYENSRNVISAVIKEGELDADIQDAILSEAVVFYPFCVMSAWSRSKQGLLADLEAIWEDNLASCPYDTDGLVIEATDQRIKKAMGHTSHHHRWQIAFKKNTEYHDIEVLSVTWQTGKSGRITPVAELKPTKISGVTVSRATCHHYGNVEANDIGAGAIVRVCRSGLVIPKIEKVIKAAEVRHVIVPNSCPSCGALTVADKDFLYCTNTVNCPAQIERTIEYFFKTLGNCDGFGPKVIEKLVSKGFNTVPKIYAMSLNDFMVTCEFGEKTSWNLFEELGASQRRAVEDWRFLAAFGITNVGKGGCERLLKQHRLKDVFLLAVDQIEAIDGFGVKTANILADALHRIYPDFEALFKLGFNLIDTPLLSEAKAILSPINKKTVVFTGSMKTGSREELQKQAKLLGAKVGSSVSSKTDYLVCGANVGASKTNDAAKHGVTILTEEQYLEMIRS